MSRKHQTEIEATTGNPSGETPADTDPAVTHGKNGIPPLPAQPDPARVASFTDPSDRTQTVPAKRRPGRPRTHLVFPSLEDELRETGIGQKRRQRKEDRAAKDAADNRIEDLWDDLRQDAKVLAYLVGKREVDLAREQAPRIENKLLAIYGLTRET
jgi:hypothetical protein